MHPVKYNTYFILCSDAMYACVYFAFPTGLSLEEVREYERTMQEKTNSKVKSNQNNTGNVAAPDLYCTEIPQEGGGGEGMGGKEKQRGERRDDTAG